MMHDFYTDVASMLVCNFSWPCTSNLISGDLEECIFLTKHQIKYIISELKFSCLPWLVTSTRNDDMLYILSSLRINVRLTHECLFVCLSVCFRPSRTFQKNGWMDFTKNFTYLFVYIPIEMTSNLFLL
jgi:hypothetical protein